jgi:hypothetical protein
MRLPTAAAAALLALAAAPAVRAEPVFALRSAVAPAFGSAADDVPVADAVSFQVPFQLDALWRRGSFAAGVYGSWGWGRVDACEGSCSASVWRAGLQGTFSFPPIHGAEPWAGLATGYEWAIARRERGGTEVSTTWRGFELLAAQGGVEWRVTRMAALGPFVLLGVGQYGDLSVDTGIESASAPIPQKALHGWIQVGVRARLVLGGDR